MDCECPKCRTAYEIDDSACRTPVVCQKCGTAFIAKEKAPDNLRPCPDCGARISRHAVNCPQCGCPLGGGSENRVIERRVIERKTAWYNWIGWLMTISSIFVIIHGIQTGDNGLSMAGCIAIIVGLLMAATIKIHCCYCEYSGPAKLTGGANGCVFLLLFCFMIIPALIYLLICRRKISCPHCGTVDV